MFSVSQLVNVTVLSDQDLWNQIDAGMTSIAVPQDLYDHITELSEQLSTFQGQQVQSTPALQLTAAVMRTLVGSKEKLEVPEKFDGIIQRLNNFLFQVKTCAEVLGISDITKQVKIAIKLLTQWHIVSQEGWAALGYCDQTMFASKLTEQLRDLHYIMRMQRDLAKLKQQPQCKRITQHLEIFIWRYVMT